MRVGTINAVLAEMGPDEIRDIPWLVDVWLRAGWMDQEVALEWRLRALAWDEYHRIHARTDTRVT